jgi:protein-disulfide isomerase
MKPVALALVLLLPCLAIGPDIDRAKALGSPSAPVRLDLYSDFQCPHCKMLHETILPAIVRDYVTTGKAYFVSHEFPLNGHTYAREAANYATAAARIGKYQLVGDAIFQNQNSWGMTGKVWDVVAAVLSPADQKKVQALAKDPSVLAEVQRDVDAGTAAHVNQTPTMIITRGMKQTPWAYWTDYNLFKGYLDEMLARKN